MDKQNERQVTVEEIIKMTIDELKMISVPAELIDSIGIRVSRALNNLKVIDNVFENAKKKQEQDEPEIEMVQVEEVPEDAEVTEL